MFICYCSLRFREFLLDDSLAHGESMFFRGFFGCENGAADAFNLDKEALWRFGKDGSQRAPVRGVVMYHQRRSQDEVPFVFGHRESVPFC